MRKIILSLVTTLISLTALGQNINGQWNGALKIQGLQLRLVFNISKSDKGWSSTMDSPDQGVKGIPTTTTNFENTTLKITVASAVIEYEGILGKDDIIVGTFKQGGQSFPMNLSRKIIQKEKLSRPQEPLPPYAYYSEDITFENKIAGISLAGTLTLPKKSGLFPVVILISGSGPQNRNEQLFEHKPFLVIADYLTKNGIGVLRYDDRGVGESKGDFKSATSADFATDVESAIAYLKTRNEVNKNKIGLIGHSEGGIIAPMVAARSKDIDFIVLLAGQGLPGDKLMLLQKEKIETSMHINREVVLKSQDVFRGAYQIIKNSKVGDVNLNNEVKAYFKQNFAPGLTDGQINSITNQVVNPWMVSFLKYDPVPALERVKCPVLAIIGEKDLQVPPQENLSAIKSALTKGGNKNITVIEFENLNHLFQECNTGLIDEYATIEQTFSPKALTEILNWINTQTH